MNHAAPLTDLSTAEVSAITGGETVPGSAEDVALEYAKSLLKMYTDPAGWAKDQITYWW